MLFENNMESLYHQTNRLVQETQQCFEKLEKVSDQNSDSIEKEIQARIDTITSICERLDIMVYKEPLTRRTNSKYRVDQLKYDKDHLQFIRQLDSEYLSSNVSGLNGRGGAPWAGRSPRFIRRTHRHDGLRPILGPRPLSPETFDDKYNAGRESLSQHMDSESLDTYRNRKYQRLQEEREREALLNHQFKPNNYEETAILMDQSQAFYSSKHHDSLKSANQGVDDMLQSGAGILESLRDQRMSLKGAHRRLYDIANTLGLSNTTMRLIEKRAYQDKFILIGGMVFTCLVIAAIIFYFT